MTYNVNISCRDIETKREKRLAIGDDNRMRAGRKVMPGAALLGSIDRLAVYSGDARAGGAEEAAYDVAAYRCDGRVLRRRRGLAFLRVSRCDGEQHESNDKTEFHEWPLRFGASP